MEESSDHLETGGHPVCHSIWSKIFCRRDLKNVKPTIAKAKKTNDRRWSRVASTGDLPTIAFFRAGVLLRRSVPVPGILATHRPGAIMDKSGRQFVARSDWGANAPLRTQRAKIFSQLLTKRKPGPHTKKPTLTETGYWPVG